MANIPNMPERSTNSHHLIHEKLLKRIHTGEWKPGAPIPTEAALAEEFNCARTTVNRALRQLASDGLVVRKRRSGTRVALTPVRRATLEIPIIRHEVERRGGAYSHHLLTCKRKSPPLWVRVRFGINSNKSMLHVQTLHLSDLHPYMFEDRWVDLDAVPEITRAPLHKISPNEWLVREVPYSRGEISFSVCMADQAVAEALETTTGASTFLVERSTWMQDAPITTLKMFYPEGFRLTMEL